MGSYDFGGWATRNDLKCSGWEEQIRRDAFKDNGCKVPISLESMNIMTECCIRSCHACKP